MHGALAIHTGTHPVLVFPLPTVLCNVPCSWEELDATSLHWWIPLPKFLVDQPTAKCWLWAGGRKFGLQERNQDTCWLLQGDFMHYCQWVSMALFFSWEKQKIDILSYLRTCPDLCGRLKMSSSLGKAGSCCVHCQSKPTMSNLHLPNPWREGWYRS